jgi:hypothetical protein
MPFVFIVSGFFLFFCIITFYLSWKYLTRLNQWWLTASVLSFFCLMELGAIWYHAYEKGLNYPKEYQAIQDFSWIKKFNPKFTIIPPIPTGIIIEHARFESPSNDIYPGIYITGYLWQRYQVGPHDSVKRGILLPDAVGQLTLKELFKEKTDHEEIIIWSFCAHVFQHFNLEDFPFDHRHIKIKLQHVDFAKNIILVPDLKTYKSILPKNLPGINNQISHWGIVESFFSYKLKNFNVDFGVQNFDSNNFPELYFYALAHRKIIASALMYIILLFISAVFLFITLLVFLKHNTLSGLLGFSTLGILSTCSALLFVLITSHFELRSNIAIQGTAYLEYIFVLLYTVILIICINSIIFTLYEKVKIIQHNNSLIIKIAYWPAILFAIAIVSFLTLVL